MNLLSHIPAFAWWALAFVVALKILFAVLGSAWFKGAFGEWVVGRKLARLPEGYVVLNDVYLPLADGTTTQIDHIVVSRYGIFVVETKNYSGWIFADEKSKVWTQTIYRKKSTFQNPMRQNYLHICTVADNLGIDHAYVKGVVVFLGGCDFKTERPAGVVYAGGVADYIRGFATPMIKDDQILEIAAVILEWASTLSRQQVSSHVKNLKARHRNHNARGRRF